MSTTSTAKRRRRQARLINGRKPNRLDFKRMMMAKNRAKG
jgi:hypothetical protein